MKPGTVIPASDLLATHERAAMEIRELRRKGVPCHLEERCDAAGHRVDIVREEPHPDDAGRLDPYSKR